MGREQTEPWEGQIHFSGQKMWHQSGGTRGRAWTLERPRVDSHKTQISGICRNYQRKKTLVLNISLVISNDMLGNEILESLDTKRTTLALSLSHTHPVNSCTQFR